MESEKWSIPTEYRGILFDSRGEARWAALFDEMGADWEYNKKPYILRNGLDCIPDFIIHDVRTRYDSDLRGIDVFVEVKGYMDSTDKAKIKMFAENHPIYVVKNTIPSGDTFAKLVEDMDNVNYNDETFRKYYNLCYVDNDFFGAYPSIGSYGHFTLTGADSNYFPSRDAQDRTITAYAIARTTRF